MPPRTWDDYYWPGTEVLANRLGLRSSAQLSRVETTLSRVRAAELRVNPIVGDFDFKHMKTIHRYLFQDVYEWAGQVREDADDDSPMYKSYEDVRRFQLGDPAAEEAWYEYPEPSLIPAIAEPLYAQLADEAHLVGMDRDQFTDRLAYYWAHLNTAHAFREGNTRSQTAFFYQLSNNAGYTLDHDRLGYGGDLREAFVGARFYAQATADHSRLADVLNGVVRVSDFAPLDELNQQREQMRAAQERLNAWVHPTAQRQLEEVARHQRPTPPQLCDLDLPQTR